MKSRNLAIGALVITLLAAVGLGAARFGVLPISSVHATTAAAPTAAARPEAAVTLPDFSSIVARNGAAVVNISTTQEVKTGGNATPFPNIDPDDPFYEFFKHFRIPVPNGRMPTRGMGSGFIVSPDGVILTNAHVVDDAGAVTVKLNDKREFRAKVVGADKQSDIAVLRIDAGNLPTVKIGDPAATRVGEWVLAVGSPFGFENSVTAGIVSAKSRSLAVSRVRDLSGFVARDLSGCHRYLKEVLDDTDGVATGDPKDEIRRGVRGLVSGAVEPGGSSAAIGGGRAHISALSEPV